MARKAAIEKVKTLKGKIARARAAGKKYKFTNRLRSRCSICGRPRGVYRKFALCRICFRQNSHKGYLPGVTKSSW